MADFYSSLTGTAARLIAGKGQAMTLVRIVAGVYDPATSSTSPPSTTRAPLVGVVFDDKSEKKSDAGVMKVVPGAGLTSIPKKILLSGSQPIPSEGDILEIGGEPHTVTSVQRLRPGGVDVLTTVFARQGA